MIAVEYDLEIEKNINFLLDYSKGMMNENINDEKIIEWQNENKGLLKMYGVSLKADKQTEKINNNVETNGREESSKIFNGGNDEEVRYF